MTPREAHLLSPYRPPTSYPVSLNAEEATSWLQGYFALWHPAALAGFDKPPQASSTYDHDQPKEGYLYTVPSGPHLYQPDDWVDRLKEASAASFRATIDAEETTTACLDACRSLGAPNELLAAPADTVLLFQSLGFGYLLIESLFDAMDHEHLLDAPGFWADVQAAVEAAKQPDHRTAVLEKLKAAGEKLLYARQVLNSSDLRMIDIAMPTSATLGAEWPASLAAGLPLTVLASGQLLEELAEKHPERFAQLKAKFLPDLPGAVDIACGAYAEREDALMPVESQFWNLRQARATVRKLFDVDTAVYARKRSALHPHLPGWLQSAGYANAVVVSFDGALTPTRNAVVVNWPSPDGKSMESFGRQPHSASDPLTFFNLVYHLHQAFTQDSTPTLALKHTGDVPAPGYAQLLGLVELGDIVGQWTGLGKLLSDQKYGDYLGSTGADDYFTDYLDDRVTNLHRPDAVSGFAVHHRLRRRLDSAFALAGLHRMLTVPSEQDLELLVKLEVLEDEMEARGADTANYPEPTREIEDAIAARLAERILARSADGQPGLLVLNPCNFTRRVTLELDNFPGAIPVVDPVKAAEFTGTSAKLVVEVPSLGFAWVPRRGPAGTLAPKSRIKLAEGTAVRNEFLEADFDPATGALRAVRDTRTRINRLGMQLVFNPGSKTRARHVAVTHAGTALGEVTCEGDILDEHDVVLATFRQRLRAWVGRPVLELRIEIDPVHAPTGYPWHSYYGARFAWRDERAAIYRGVNGQNFPSTYTRPCSPDYLELRIGGERSFVFTGGLPFIQKQNKRMADILLIPEGETCRSFDLLLALDRELPMQTAAGWVAPTPVVHTEKGPPPGGASGWLGHVDLPSLLMTSLRPVPPSEGKTRAVAMRLTETAGYAGASAIQFARDPANAMAIDNDGKPGAELEPRVGEIPLEFSANETIRVRAEWE